MITTLLVQRPMGFGRERGIKEDLEFSGTSTWADGEDIHVHGGTWERNRMCPLDLTLRSLVILTRKVLVDW